MDELLWELAKVFVVPFVASFFAAYIAYSLAHRRFIRERWWDRKADAYGSIIGSLVSMLHSLNFLLSEIEYWGGGPKGQKQRKVPSEYLGARAQIERVATEGDYVISERASHALSDLMGKLPLLKAGGLLTLDDWVSWLRETRGAVASCLEVVRAEARSDLGVRRWI